MNRITSVACVSALAACSGGVSGSAGNPDGARDGAGADLSGDPGVAYACRANADGTCSALTANTKCLPFTGRLYDPLAACTAGQQTTLYCQASASSGTAGGFAPAVGCFKIAGDAGTLLYWTPNTDPGSGQAGIGACDATTGALVRAASPCGSVPDGALPDAPGCSKYPTTSRIDAGGLTWWWWYFHWQADAALCASYGVDAMMVVEVDVPQNTAATSTLPPCTTDEIATGGSRACALAGAYRFTATCGAGELLFELPSENVFHGWYHIESSQVKAPPRHLINQDVHCARDLYIVAPSYGPVDAGVSPVGDTGRDGSVEVDGGCALDTTGLPGSYEECVAAGGTVVPATASLPALCAVTYLSPSTDYQRCKAGGGESFVWDLWCPAPSGGQGCSIYYPRQSCPTSKGPGGYENWHLPSCPPPVDAAVSDGTPAEVAVSEVGAS